MRCRLCGSDDLSWLTGEFALHFPGLKSIDKPVVWVLPQVCVCLHCGNAEFSIPEGQLLVLSIANAAVTDSTAANSVGRGRLAELSSSDSPEPS
jgi:hypothetical protein